MLGKLIAHGATREEARRKLLRAVQDTVLLGVQSNQRLLAGLLQHPQFISGDFSTAFITQHFSDHPSLHTYSPSAEDLAIAAMLFYQTSALSHRAPLSGWRNNANVALHYRLGRDEQNWTLQLLAQAHGIFKVQVAERTLELKLVDRDAQSVTLEVDGLRQTHPYLLDGEQLWLFTHPGSLQVEDRTHAVIDSQTSVSSGTLKAPMDGAIVDVLVSEGSPVSKGQLLVVLEAMKMEHPLKAGIDGVLKRVQVKVGDQVKNRQVLLQVE
jgi:geranyl-CoA carboxylase alpha subunit